MSKKKLSSAANIPTSPYPTPHATKDAATNAVTGAATGAAAGLGLWGLAMPVANLIGFTTSGIASGSTAASMMSAAAVANGGGVVSGGVVAVMQSIGAVGLATPVGLGLVTGAAAIGGAALLVTSRICATTDESDTMRAQEEKGLWVLVELSAGSGKPKIRTFDDDYTARNAFLNSSATSKALFDPEQKMVLELGWKESMKDLVKRE